MNRRAARRPRRARVGAPWEATGPAPGNRAARARPTGFVRGAVPILALLVAGCGGEARGPADGGSEPAGGPRGELLVSAAASLTDAFTDLAAVFETAHPGVEVTLNLAGSPTLRTQILEGAPVDVFASADEATMAAVEAAGEVAAHPRTFARNHLVLAVPPGNPGSVKGLEDLAREELWVGLCAPEVPCGRYARAVLERAGVKPALDTEEADVRALLTRVALGELDVAVTYATDVAAAGGQAEAIVIPDSVNVVAELPVAVLAAAPNPAAARSFVDLLTSAPGRRVLARHGFALP